MDTNNSCRTQICCMSDIITNEEESGTVHQVIIMISTANRYLTNFEAEMKVKTIKLVG
jgi:hypothetical protein